VGWRWKGAPALSSVPIAAVGNVAKQRCCDLCKANVTAGGTCRKWQLLLSPNVDGSVCTLFDATAVAEQCVGASPCAPAAANYVMGKIY
jgi:hypothetical protein